VLNEQEMRKLKALKVEGSKRKKFF
jgi:hypothetical protein